MFCQSILATPKWSSFGQLPCFQFLPLKFTNLRPSIPPAAFLVARKAFLSSSHEVQLTGSSFSCQHDDSKSPSLWYSRPTVSWQLTDCQQNVGIRGLKYTWSMFGRTPDKKHVEGNKHGQIFSSRLLELLAKSVLVTANLSCDLFGYEKPKRWGEIWNWSILGVKGINSKEANKNTQGTR